MMKEPMLFVFLFIVRVITGSNFFMDEIKKIKTANYLNNRAKNTVFDVGGGKVCRVALLGELFALC